MSVKSTSKYLWVTLFISLSVAFILILYVRSIYLIPDYDKIYHDFYSYDNVYINTRSSDTIQLSDLDRGLLLMEAEKFEEALICFDNVPNSITATYYSGVIFMEQKEYEIAIFKFDTIINQRLNVFYDQAYWYKGLCLLKLDRIEESKDIFKKISDDSFYKSGAVFILEELD